MTKEEAEKFASKNNLVYIETSAKEHTNVDRAFIEPATKILHSIETN